MTTEKFIPDPFSDEPGARLYKTGDLVRYLPDGNIEFLGRIDNQVKIRGVRIELGEIEGVLGNHPAVREAVVLLREDTPGDQRLAAYVVSNQQPPPTISELRRFLEEKLPHYMVPTSFVTLDTLPLNPNGKVDHRALPAPDRSRSGLEEAFVAPRTPVEEVLVGIWGKVLGADQVGIHDNFFGLGGDSILSIQLVSRANEANVRLTPKQVFQYQTIAELAAVAHTGAPIGTEQRPVTGPVPLTPIQRWFFEQDPPDKHHWNMAMMLEARQPLDPLLLERALQQLLEYHDALRLRFVQGESGWHQVNSALDQAVPFKLVDLSELAEVEQESAIKSAAAEMQARLDLAKGPILRVALF